MSPTWIITKRELKANFDTPVAYIVLCLTLPAVAFNFFLNNTLTYADKRLSGFVPLVRGWAKFGLTCSIGLLANVGVAAVLVRFGFHEYPAAITGIVIGSVWNFALSSRFVWGRY